MTGIRVSEHFGIIIRKAVLHEHSISLQALLQAMETDHPLDENNDLFSFGPHFGEEAANAFIGRLETLGLRYGNDFFDLDISIPDWCQLYVALRV